MTNKKTPQFQRKLLAGVLAALFITGCGDGKNNDPVVDPGGDGHDGEHHNKGRLIVSEKDQVGLHIIDLDDQSMLENITTTNPVSYLHTSPDGRYVVAVQRDNNLVEFVDSGLWLKAHDDHMDLVEEAPSLLDYQLQTIKPTHYNTVGHQAALFSDGNKSSGEAAGFQIFDDASIASGAMVASHTLDYAVHGALQIRGEYVLATVVSDLDAQTAPTYNMPDSVALFELHNDHFHQEEVFAEQCPGLHGSFQGENWTVFGCSDGILAIEQQGMNFTASKIANPAGLEDGVYIGTIKGNNHLDKFLGMTRTQQAFLIDPALQSINEIEWKSSPDVSMKAYTIDAHQEHFIVLDSMGYLNLFDVASDYAESVRFKVLEMPEAAATTKAASATIKYQMVSSAEQLFISNPENNSIIVVDLHEQKVESTIELDFTPNQITWAGIVEEEADHEH